MNIVYMHKIKKNKQHTSNKQNKNKNQTYKQEINNINRQIHFIIYKNIEQNIYWIMQTGIHSITYYSNATERNIYDIYFIMIHVYGTP